MFCVAGFAEGYQVLEVDFAAVRIAVDVALLQFNVLTVAIAAATSSAGPAGAQLRPVASAFAVRRVCLR